MADNRSHRARPANAADDPTPEVAEPQFEPNPDTGVYEPLGGHQQELTEEATRREVEPTGPARGEEADPDFVRTDDRWMPAPGSTRAPFMTPDEEAAYKRYVAEQASQADWLPAPALGRPAEETRARAFYPQPEDGAVYEVAVDTLGSGPFLLERGDRFTADQMAAVHRHFATGARVGVGTAGAGPAYDLPWLLHHQVVRKVGQVREAAPSGRRREADD